MHSPPVRARLASVPLFASLTQQELERLSGKAEVVSAKPGEVLIQQGTHGDRMYVIARGSVQVYAKGFDASDIVLARLEAGEFFGEQALLPSGTHHRNASVRALEACQLLAISKEALLEALNPHGDLMQRLRSVGEQQQTFRRSKLRENLFAGLGVIAGAESHRIEAFASGETVFLEGDPGDRVYLILEGRAAVLRRQEQGEVQLAELLPGQFFGELAILHDAPRAATVRALDDLEVVSLGGAWFREALRTTPALESLMQSLSKMYLLPRRGVLTLQTGQVEGQATLTAVHSLPDGRRVVSTRLITSAGFTSRMIGPDEATEKVLFEDADRHVHRELEIASDRIVGIHAEGEWTKLGETLSLMLDRTAIEHWKFRLFRERGEFTAEDPQPLYEDRETLCACTHASRGQVTRAIAAGCHTLDAVARETHATMVCGGCAPLVKELLGKSDWSPAAVVQTLPLADDIRTFRIRPASGRCKAYRPGQHVVVQARIDNRWIQRAYTLSSPPEATQSYDITVKREPKGVFSRWLFDRLKEDDLLRVSEPGGNYFLDEDEGRDVVCLVAGIGVTPALAMARALMVRPRPFRLHVDYSVSEPKNAICVDELMQISRTNNNISVNFRATRKQGRFGEKHARELVERFPEAVFFLCGSEAYMDAVKEYLRRCGVAEERIRIEVFTIAGAKPAIEMLPEATGCPVQHGPVVGERPKSPLEKARNFLEQYYSETGAPQVFEARWQQVQDEFGSTGGYRQTTEELAYAAKLAWRNSTRCVGRLYWEGLAVRDFRNVTTGEGMLDAIMEHIAMATNGGSLRPVMTVFPPQEKDGSGPRVWSPQLFRYAGYPSADGIVLGDPGNVELTEVALALGWKPPAKRSAFDLLPVIVQAKGEPPNWREIPCELVLEVPIVHPEYAWFADLGLKWYALPAVAAMRFDAAGVHYTAAPFNGWYMVTEIGARNFGDIARYNLLPIVAQKMGLDTAADRTLWRDRAIVELNVAVMHSYDRAGVTMIDHHAASHAFDKFEAIENQQGRVVHARWSWIVPPISGSTVTVFHKDHWRDIELTPNYYPQPDAWTLDTSWRTAKGASAS